MVFIAIPSVPGFAQAPGWPVVLVATCGLALLRCSARISGSFGGVPGTPVPGAASAIFDPDNLA